MFCNAFKETLLKKKKRERPMKRGEREREGKKETNKKRGTLVSCCV